MAEGARLESVYAGNRIEGSNPSPSAIICLRVAATPTLPACSGFELRLEPSANFLSWIAAPLKPRGTAVKADDDSRLARDYPVTSPNRFDS